jgi:formylglycine-generating enzyme required for sulfatase activity
LPTEAEWEYACRAGTQAAFHYGNSLSSHQANFNGNDPYGGAEKGTYLQKTTPVGKNKPNDFGLYDMHGNVWEWCADWFWGEYYTDSPKQDPQGPPPGDSRVLRGGSYEDGGRWLRSARRNGDAPGRRYNGYGFRVAVSAVAGLRSLTAVGRFGWSG